MRLDQLNKSDKRPDHDYSKVSNILNYRKSSELDMMPRRQAKFDVLVKKYGKKHEIIPSSKQVWTLDIII